MENRQPFASTVRFGPNEQFSQQAKLLPVPDMIAPGKYRLLDEFRLLITIIKAARREKLLLLFSSRGSFKPDLLAAAFLGLWPKRWRPQIVLYGEMFEPNSGWRKFIERLVLYLADRAIRRYVVFSSKELEVFPESWHVNPSKMSFCPYFIKGQTLPAPPPHTVSGHHVFAGGDSLRDYTPLIEAGRQMPDVNIVISTSRLKPSSHFPPNVTLRETTRQEYRELLTTAGVVVIPCQLGLRRTAGLYTLLQAMWLKKVVIVPENLGIRDYVSNGEAIIVDGSSQSYVDAIRWVLNPTHQDQLEAMCEAAYQSVNGTFTLESHIATLLHIIDDVRSPATPTSRASSTDPVLSHHLELSATTPAETDSPKA